MARGRGIPQRVSSQGPVPARCVRVGVGFQTAPPSHPCQCRGPLLVVAGLGACGAAKAGLCMTADVGSQVLDGVASVRPATCDRGRLCHPYDRQGASVTRTRLTPRPALPTAGELRPPRGMHQVVIDTMGVSVRRRTPRVWVGFEAGPVLRWLSRRIAVETRL